VLSDAAALLPGYPRRVARRVHREAEQRGIAIREGARVVAVEPDAVLLEEGRVPCDLAVWATGAAPLPFPSRSPLPVDEEGFVRVRRTLQVLGHDDLFAAGDCASLADAPWVRKAGVYAVREGPWLEANLRALLRGRRPGRYRPQRHFLSLLNLGEERALAAKWGAVAVGRWVWRWKDRIDRRFVRRFQVLTPDGRPAPAFPARAMGTGEMRCGGCAAKVSAPVLARALGRLPAPPPDPSVLVGLERPDDAAAVRLPRGDVLLGTVDAFRAFTDDPWLVGRVAAVNAASDVLAKGGRPRHALAVVTVPEEDPGRAEETLHQVLAGVRAALDPIGVSLVGGHTTSGPELFVGLSVVGDLPGGVPMLGLAGARPGDVLVLTKPLGTGVVLAADAQGRARGTWVVAAVASMLRPNSAAAGVARAMGAHACTDVSGFGLSGHLTQTLRASGVSASVVLASLPALAGARALLAQGIRSSFHDQNAPLGGGLWIDPALADEPAVALLFDPQTSGGLLFALEPARAGDAIRALHEGGDRDAAVIGVVGEPRADGAALVVVGTWEQLDGLVRDGGAARRSSSARC
jgi:selenide,water dikinase